MSELTLSTLSRNLKRRSTIKLGESYSIRRTADIYRGGKQTMTFKESGPTRLISSLVTKPKENIPDPVSSKLQISFKNRCSTQELYKNPSDYKKKFSHIEKRNTFEIPYDFAKTLSKSAKNFKLLGRDTTLPKQSEIFEAREDNQNINEISDSKEDSDDFTVHKLKKSISFKVKDEDESSILGSSTENIDFRLRERLKPGKLATIKRDSLESLSNQTLIKSAVPEDPEEILLKTPTFSQKNILTFEEALAQFSSMPAAYTELNLWHSHFYEYFSCCLTKNNELDEEALEICEKLIVFAYTGFNPHNFYHTSLLFSVLNILQLQTNKTEWVDVGFSTDDPYETDLLHNMSAIGLLLIMFLYRFVPASLGEIVKYSIDHDIAFVSLAFDVAEVAVMSLRKKKLNLLMIESQKCLEVVFFYYAGCLLHWFYLHNLYTESHSKITRMLEKQANENLKYMIEIAKSHMSNQD